MWLPRNLWFKSTANPKPMLVGSKQGRHQPDRIISQSDPKHRIIQQKRKVVLQPDKLLRWRNAIPLEKAQISRIDHRIDDDYDVDRQSRRKKSQGRSQAKRLLGPAERQFSRGVRCSHHVTKDLSAISTYSRPYTLRLLFEYFPRQLRESLSPGPLSLEPEKRHSRAPEARPDQWADRV